MNAWRVAAPGGGAGLSRNATLRLDLARLRSAGGPRIYTRADARAR